MRIEEKRAREQLDLVVKYNLSTSVVETADLPLTDQECKDIAKTTIFSYEEIRKIYPKKEEIK